MGKFQSIELGAGESEFGRKFYQKCLETDSDLSLLNTNCIDVITDAHKICVDDGSFDRVILCNPYEYGFIREEGLVLLREIVRILKAEKLYKLLQRGMVCINSLWHFRSR